MSIEQVAVFLKRNSLGLSWWLSAPGEMTPDTRSRNQRNAKRGHDWVAVHLPTSSQNLGLGIRTFYEKHNPGICGVYHLVSRTEVRAVKYALRGLTFHNDAARYESLTIGSRKTKKKRPLY
jgi:hypothetical protein